MKTNKERIIEKYKMLSEKKPLGVDLKNIDPIGLYNESQNDNILKHRLTRFEQIFGSLEGLKQFVVPYYKSHSDNVGFPIIRPFKNRVGAVPISNRNKRNFSNSKKLSHKKIKVYRKPDCCHPEAA